MSPAILFVSAAALALVVACRAPSASKAEPHGAHAAHEPIESAPQTVIAVEGDSTDAFEPAPSADLAPATTPRPAEWARPIEQRGVPNLHQVTPTVYRSAQPTQQGFAALDRMGVRTVLSLRAFHADTLPAESRLERERVSFKSWHPEMEDVVRCMRILTDESKQPVLVHCQHGADRTGMMLAIYRIVEQGWSKEAAIDEMVGGGYGYHSIWKNLIDYIRALDVEGLRRELEKR